MTDEQRRCLGEREILDYLDGGLPEGQRAEIEHHLDECRLCGAAVEGVRGLEWREGFVRSADAVRARVRARTVAALPRRAARRFRVRPQYLALAATLVLGVGAVVILTRPGPGEALFQRYFEPYPSMRPVLRAALEGRSNALTLYEARDYRGALATFERDGSRTSDDPEVVFYSGLSRLALGQAREATVDLEKVLKLGDDELVAPAAWYLALAHLRGGDVAVARAHLERIAGTKGFYRARARELLSEMDRLAGGR
jgi:tetratricopeptide (TPR) repeat protein